VEIPYPTRSRFLGTCENAIRAQRAELESGGTVHAGLSEGGYDGQVVVTIDPDERTAFQADWNAADPTRFPARIRAAAAALRDSRLGGRFEVSHSGGSLTIRRISQS